MIAVNMTSNVTANVSANFAVQSNSTSNATISVVQYAPVNQLAGAKLTLEQEKQVKIGQILQSHNHKITQLPPQRLSGDPSQKEQERMIADFFLKNLIKFFRFFSANFSNHEKFMIRARNLESRQIYNPADTRTKFG